MAKTIRLTPKQETALIWAMNSFAMAYEDYDLDPEDKKEFEKAWRLLAPIYDNLESEN